MFQKSLSILFFCLALGTQAQNMKMTPIRPVQVTALVVGILEGNTELAVLYVMEVDSTNEFLLEPKTEILVRFQFDTKPTTGEPKLPGVSKDDVIEAEIAGELDPGSGQMNYRVFRYRVLPTKTLSPDVNGSPQK